jgi:hypothetical protein
MSQREGTKQRVSFLSPVVSSTGTSTCAMPSHAYGCTIERKSWCACQNEGLQGLPTVGTVRAKDCMDDGTPIQLAVTIDRTTGSAVFDFEGTGPQVLGNTNAPTAVTYSAVIYALRCLVASDIPLNGGCLAPVTVKVRPLVTCPIVLPSFKHSSVAEPPTSQIFQPAESPLRTSYYQW